MFNYNRAFELENGVILSEGGPGIFGVGETPNGNDAPVGSIAIDSRGFRWFKKDAGASGWVLAENIRPIYSSKPTYSSGQITAIEYFNSTTQVTANRVARVDLTYTGDNLTGEEIKVYQSDGTTVERIFTNTYTYTSDDLTNAETAET